MWGRSCRLCRFFCDFFFVKFPMPPRSIAPLLAVAVWLLATGCASAGFDEGRSAKLATELEELGFSTKAIKVRVCLCCFISETCPDGPPEHSPSTFITTDGLSVVRLRLRE